MFSEKEKLLTYLVLVIGAFLLVVVALMYKGNLTIFEDGSFRLFGTFSGCIPFNLCS